jgi:hypothetical protein
LDLILAIVVIVIVSTILLVLVLLFIAVILARIQMWWMERHPKVWPPAEPSACPGCDEVAFELVAVSSCSGLDENGEHAGWSEFLGECTACGTKFFRVDNLPWRVAESREWQDYIDRKEHSAYQSNKFASYYSGETGLE